MTGAMGRHHAPSHHPTLTLGTTHAMALPSTPKLNGAVPNFLKLLITVTLCMGNVLLKII